MIIPSVPDIQVSSPMNLKRASLPTTSLDSVEVASFLAGKLEKPQKTYCNEIIYAND